MEFLLMGLGVLVYSVVGVIIYAVVSCIIDDITEWRDYKAGNAILRKKGKEISALKKDLELWKTACDNLDKEVKELKSDIYPNTRFNYEVTCEAKKKSNLS